MTVIEGHVMNPHSVVVQASGLVDDIDTVCHSKSQTDPHDLLSRGKLGAKP